MTAGSGAGASEWERVAKLVIKYEKEGGKTSFVTNFAPLAKGTRRSTPNSQRGDHFILQEHDWALCMSADWASGLHGGAVEGEASRRGYTLDLSSALRPFCQLREGS